MGGLDMKYVASAVAIVAATVALSGAAIAQDKPAIAFVVNGPSDFWKLAEAGVQAAQAELPDVELQFRYPERADAAVQQRRLDLARTRRLDERNDLRVVLRRRRRYEDHAHQQGRGADHPMD